MRDYFARWQVQHHAPDLDPGDTTALRLFLTFTYHCARPFARRRVAPDAITLLGLAWAGVVVVVVGFSPAVAALFVVISAVTDGVDGCVAALTDRATRFGYVLDSVVDRTSDGLFLLALLIAGGEAWLAVAAGCAIVGLEYTRARAGAAGLGEIGVVTVGERATRTIAAAMGLIGSQVLTARPWVGPNVGLAITLAASAIGTFQLLAYLWKHWR